MCMRGSQSLLRHASVDCRTANAPTSEQGEAELRCHLSIGARTALLEVRACVPCVYSWLCMHARALCRARVRAAAYSIVLYTNVDLLVRVLVMNSSIYRSRERSGRRILEAETTDMCLDCRPFCVSDCVQPGHMFSVAAPMSAPARAVATTRQLVDRGPSPCTQLTPSVHHVDVGSAW